MKVTGQKNHLSTEQQGGGVVKQQQTTTPAGLKTLNEDQNPAQTQQLLGQEQAKLSQGGAKQVGGTSLIGARAQSLNAVEPIFFSKHNGPAIDFPMTKDQAAKLAQSNAVSPFVIDDPRVHIRPDFLTPPTHPGDKGYFKELEEVVDMQLARRKGGQASEIFDVPQIFADFTIEKAAQAVRADFPSDFPTALVKQFLGEGAKVDSSIIPAKTQAEFVDGPVLLSRIIGWAVSEVSPSAFACKWHEGRARPESAVWAIHNGEMEAPAALKKKIKSLKLKSPEDFTAYQEGCPRHPSWPAMHSAASAASLYLAVVMDLSPEQITEARRLDFAVATSRTLAGVHFDSDNRAGLSLGQEVLAKQLPAYLEQFGADPEAVKAKIASLRYDWDQHPAKAE